MIRYVGVSDGTWIIGSVGKDRQQRCGEGTGCLWGMCYERVRHMGKVLWVYLAFVLGAKDKKGFVGV